MFCLSLSTDAIKVMGDRAGIVAVAPSILLLEPDEAKETKMDLNDLAWVVGFGAAMLSVPVLTVLAIF